MRARNRCDYECILLSHTRISTLSNTVDDVPHAFLLLCQKPVYSMSTIGVCRLRRISLIHQHCTNMPCSVPFCFLTVRVANYCLQSLVSEGGCWATLCYRTNEMETGDNPFVVNDHFLVLQHQLSYAADV